MSDHSSARTEVERRVCVETTRINTARNVELQKDRRVLTIAFKDNRVQQLEERELVITVKLEWRREGRRW